MESVKPKINLNNLNSLNEYDPNRKVGTYTVVDVVKGILLLTLAITGNYIGELLGCKVQYLLTTSGWAKNIILFFTIYFALTVFNYNVILHPVETLKYTALLFVCFKLFSKTNQFFSILIFSLIAVIYVLTNFNQYYTQQKESPEKIRKVKKLEEILTVILLIVLVFASAQYLFKQYNEYKDTKEGFSLMKYFFTHTQCNSLKNL